MGCFYNEVPISLSYSLKVELAMVLGSELGLRLRVQRKLVNVRPLSKAEAQVVQFSHSSMKDTERNWQ